MEKFDELIFNNPYTQEIFNSIFEITSEAVWILDVKRGKSVWLASEENKLKFAIRPRVEGVPDDYWITGLHPEDKDYAAAGFQNALSNRAITFFEHEYRFRGASDQYFHIQDKMKFWRNVSGEAEVVVGVWTDVTDRHYREEKLDELLTSMEDDRKRFRIISEASNAAMWEVDFSRGLVRWTAGKETLKELGLSEEYKPRKEWENSIHPDDRARAVSYFYNIVVSDGIKYHDEYRVLKPDGSIAYMIDQGYIIRNAEGKATRALGGWIDVTGERCRELELKEALDYQEKMNEELSAHEEELASSEEELRQINEQLSINLQILTERDFIISQSQQLARIGSWGFEPDTLRMTWSDEMFNIFGVDKGFDHNNIEEILPLFEENSRLMFREIYLSMTRRENLPFDITAQIRTPIGYRKWIRLTAYTVMEKTRIPRIVGLLHDVTYFKESEERLRTSEEKFSKAFRNNPDMMNIIREEDRMILDVNDRVFAMLGYTREELIGRLATELRLYVHDEEKSTFYEEYALSGQVDMESTWRKKDGSHIQVLVSSSRLELEGKKCILSVVRDITDKKRAEEKLIESEANLSATINNTEFLIWSVDREYKILKFNDPFRAYSKTVFGIDLAYKDSLLAQPWMAGHEDIRNKWKERYNRALAGETVKISEERGDYYFDISLNPIIDSGKIIGASVFAENVSERVRKEKELAEALNKIGELKLMALRSVMNPHFIFNALNSIQYFIAQNDRKNAINYLSTFSKLVRGILTHSLSNKIKLSEELDQLRNYVSLEQVRFENKFDFVVKIEGQLDLEAIEIPSLLIQPYVENAILHGLYNKEGKGILSISVTEENDSIVFEIEDNGIGRSAAMDLRNQNFPKHKSMGTALTEERLKLINAQDKVSFEIIDLMDKKNRAAGTKVRIWVKE